MATSERINSPPLSSLCARGKRERRRRGGGASNLCSFSLKVREMRRRRRRKRGIPPPPPPLWVIASFVVRSTRRRRKRKRRRRGSLGQRKCQEEEGLSSLSVFLFSLLVVGMDTSPNRFTALAHTHNAFLNFPREKKKRGKCDISPRLSPFYLALPRYKWEIDPRPSSPFSFALKQEFFPPPLFRLGRYLFPSSRSEGLVGPPWFVRVRMRVGVGTTTHGSPAHT